MSRTDSRDQGDKPRDDGEKAVSVNGSRDIKNPSWLRRRRWRIVLCVAAALAVGIVVAIPVLNALACRAVRTEVTAIRARGEPTHINHFIRPSVPAEVNAALVFEEAFTKLNAGSPRIRRALNSISRLRRIFLTEGELEDRDLDIVRDILGKTTESMALARQALALPHCRFPIDYPKLGMRHLRYLGYFNDLFALQVILHTSSGRPRRAAEGLKAVLGLQRLSAADLVYSPADGLSFLFRFLHRLANTVDIGDEARREIIASLAEFDILPWSIRSVKFGRALCIQANDAAVHGDKHLQAFFNAHLPNEPARPAFRFFWTEAKVLSLLAEGIEGMGRPPWEASPLIARIDSRMDALHPEEKGVYRTNIPYGTIVAGLTRRDLARIGLALQLHNSARGRYPESLQELAPHFLARVPKDPHTGNDFEYERGGGGCRAGHGIKYVWVLGRFEPD